MLKANKPRDGRNDCDGCFGGIRFTVATVAAVAREGRQHDLPRPPSPSKNPQSLRWMWADDYVQRMPANKLLPTPVFAVCIDTANRKTGSGIRRCRIPHAPPRRAHDTLQPQDESIIVGYYTSAGSAPRPAGRTNVNGALWRETTGLTVPVQET